MLVYAQYNEQKAPGWGLLVYYTGPRRDSTKKQTYAAHSYI